MAKLINWYQNLQSHYHIELTWDNCDTSGLELILVKDAGQIDYNNLLHEDADGRIWLEKLQEQRTNPMVHIGKILWCMNCNIGVYVRPLYADVYLAENIILSVYKGDEKLEEFQVNSEDVYLSGKLLVCEIKIPNSLYGIVEID